jgi:hypothetical protein
VSSASYLSAACVIASSEVLPKAPFVSNKALKAAYSVFVTTLGSANPMDFPVR